MIRNIALSRNRYGMRASGPRVPVHIPNQETPVSKLASIRTTTLSLALVVAAGFSASASAADVTGAGASFVYPLMSKWSADYAKASSKKVNYQSIGSGGGIAQIKAGTVDFGSSDAPLKPEELAKFGLAQFPSVIGGVVPVVNIPGVAGRCAEARRPAARRHLPRQDQDLERPGDRRTQPRREAAGEEDHHRAPLRRFGHHLQLRQLPVQGQPGVEDEVGEGTAVKWPAGIGGKGNEGVAAYVKQINGGIGYVELSYALQNKMTYARMKNAAGNFVSPSDDSFAAAAASADWANAKDFYLVMTNAPGEQAWPITATNFILMYKQPKDAPGQGREGLLRLGLRQRRCAGQGARLRAAADALVQQIEAYWTANLKY